jgi:two-component system sensor kinase FixL
VNLLMAEPYAGEHDGYIERYERTKEPRAIGRIRVVAARRKNGDVFPIELSVTEIHTDQEVHYAAFIRDISEKVRLQEQLLDNERLATIGATAAKLAHEIGNPLNSMSITLQLLQRRLRSYETVLDDAEKLKQVVLNLCKNAVEAMPEGGRLTVCARCEAKQVCVEVADTGVGIPPGVNIFEPFVTTKAEGTGLGLSIA